MGMSCQQTSGFLASTKKSRFELFPHKRRIKARPKSVLVEVSRPAITNVSSFANLVEALDRTESMVELSSSC
jgi:hypothetical protein